MEKGTENTRVTLIGIIVEDPEAAIRICKCNHFCHTFVIHRPNFRKLPDLAVDEKQM